MNLAIRIAAAILSVPPDVLAPFSPLFEPTPRNNLEKRLRHEVNTLLSGECSAAEDVPLFAISSEEANFVNCNSGLPGDVDVYKSDENDVSASTYGEITLLGARQLFHHMGLTKLETKKPEFHLYDLGSGGGRLVMQSYLELPAVRNSVGIELSPTRHNIAIQAFNSLQENGDIKRIRNLAHRAWGVEHDNKEDEDLLGIELYEGDLFKLDISRATHIYVSSLCFSADMLELLVEKIEREAISVQVIASIRKLPVTESNSDAVVRIGRNPWQEWIEMSWSKDGCRVYLYSVEKMI